MSPRIIVSLNVLATGRCRELAKSWWNVRVGLGASKTSRAAVRSRNGESEADAHYADFDKVGREKECEESARGVVEGVDAHEEDKFDEHNGDLHRECLQEERAPAFAEIRIRDIIYR